MSGKFTRYQRQLRRKTREDRYEPKTAALGPRRTRSLPKKPSRASGRKVERTALKDKFKPANISQERLTLDVTVGGLFRHGRASSPIMRNELPDLAFPELDFLASHPKDKRDYLHHPTGVERKSSLDKYHQDTIPKYFSPSHPRPRPIVHNHSNGSKGLLQSNPRENEVPEMPLAIRHGHFLSPLRLQDSYRKRFSSEARSSVAGPDQSNTYYTWSRTNSVQLSGDPEGRCRINGAREKLERPISTSSSQVDSRVRSMLFHNAYIPKSLGRYENTLKAYSLEDLFEKAAETSPLLKNANTPLNPRLVQEPRWKNSYGTSGCNAGRSNMPSSPYHRQKESSPSARKKPAGWRGCLGHKLKCPVMGVDTPEPAIYAFLGRSNDTHCLATAHQQRFSAHYDSDLAICGRRKDNALRSPAQNRQEWQLSRSSKLCVEPEQSQNEALARQFSSGTPTFDRQYRLYGSPPHFNLPKNSQSDFVDLDLEYPQGGSSSQFYLLDNEIQTLGTPTEPDGYPLHTPQKQDMHSHLESNAQGSPCVKDGDAAELNFDPWRFWRPNKLY
ncbi:hypothetical protein MferCBS31731_003069 [Microsporum ferrugineum]